MRQLQKCYRQAHSEFQYESITDLPESELDLQNCRILAITGMRTGFWYSLTVKTLYLISQECRCLVR